MNAIGRYIKEMYSAHRRLFFRTMTSVEGYVSPSNACRIRNVRQILQNRATRFSYNENQELYLARDQFAQVYFASSYRGFQLYSKGIRERGKEIAESYFIDRILFDKDDIVIDCGANYGDLMIYLAGKVERRRYVAFEPGAEEFKALSKNIEGSILNCAGLGDETRKRTLYISSKEADSSFIPPKMYEETVEIQQVKLDDYIKENAIESIKLLKIEAEGFEPEVLNGARRSLTLCEYVAIDGGYERGVNSDETFCVQCNLLLENGFAVEAIHLERGRALFKRKL